MLDDTQLLLPRYLKVFSAFSFSVIVMCLPLFHAFAANVTNLQLPFLELAAPILWVSVFVTFVIWLVLLASPKSIEKPILLFLVYFCVYAWLQTNFFVGDYGFLDGRKPDWGEGKIFSYLQIALQVTIGVFFVVQSKFVLKSVPVILGFLLLSSMVFVYPDVSRSKLSMERKYTFSQNQVFGFSMNKNVLVFVVDTLQVDVVNEILEADPAIANAFKGFTLFRNALSAFPKTYASVPAILSGLPFDNATALPEYLQDVYYNHSLPAYLKGEGFDVRIHSWVPQSLLPAPQLANNISGTQGRDTDSAELRKTDIALLLNLSLFRLVPHLVKPWVYNEGNYRVRFQTLSGGAQHCSLLEEQKILSSGNHAFDARFFDQFLGCAKLSFKQPVFRFYHLVGSHAPLQFDEDFLYIGNQPISRKNYKSQTRGVLKQLARVLQKLEQLGIYSQSTVLILGDHGAGEFPVGVNTMQPNLPKRKLEAGSKLNQLSIKKIQGGIPVILAKPATTSPGETLQDLQFSNVPVSLNDIPNTVVSDLGLDSDRFPGMSLFAVEKHAQRKRLHKFYQFSGWNIDYIVPMIEYEIDGFSWYPESWRLSARNLSQTASDSYAGLLITTGVDGNIKDFERRGWSKPQELGVHIGDRQASIVARFSADEDVVLRIVHTPYPSSANSIETIVVKLGDHLLGRWKFYPGDTQSKKHVVIRQDIADMLVDTPLVFVSDADNSRVRIKTIRLDDLSEFVYSESNRVDFTNLGFGHRYQTFGWASTETWGAFSSGHESGLLLKMASRPSEDLQLGIVLGAILYEQWNEQILAVIVNGLEVGEFKFRNKSPQELAIKIPANLVTETGVIDLRFEYKTPVQPRWVSPSSDRRLLAISIKKLRLMPWKNDTDITSVVDHSKHFKLLAIAGGERLVDAGGREYEQNAPRISGFLDSMASLNGVVQFVGWALNREQPDDSLAIVVFADSKLLAVRELHFPRADVAEHFGTIGPIESGFRFGLPRDSFKAVQRLRIFAVSSYGVARELVYPANIQCSLIQAGQEADIEC